jgi:hypothetical protein
MTAEVAIVNPFAVALAADSAVTINTSNGETKIFNSVEKLFRISESQPIALMVYGNGNFADIGWELMAKQFRSDNADVIFEKVEDCAHAFLSFLKNRTDIVSLESRAIYAFGKLETFIRDAFTVVLDKIGGSEVNDDIVRLELLNEFQKHKVALDGLDFRFELSEEDELIIEKELAPRINSLSAQIFAAFIDKKLSDLILETSTKYLTRCHESGNPSGLVFAGFGSVEFKPTVESYILLGGMSNYIFAQRNGSLCHDPKNSVSVIPFAQGDVIQSFIKGIAPSINISLESHSRTYAVKTIEKTFSILDSLDVEVAKELRTDFISFIDQERNSFLTNVTNSSNEKLVDPIIGMLQFLPKDELATMAESLVNMTAFRRKVSHDNETVGGPIDVAVLSKNDGFVWIKRKHYFPREMNDHFFKNRG